MASLKSKIKLHETTEIDINPNDLNDSCEQSDNLTEPLQKADLIKAEKHRQARLVKQVNQAMKDPKMEKCECCGFPLDAKPFLLSCSLMELSELGSGFPLFFLFIKIICLIMVLGIAIISIPCIIDNSLAEKGDDWQSNKESWIIKSSLGNQGDVDNIYPFWQCILNIVFMALIILFYHISKWYLSRRDYEMDIYNITSRDFTIHAYGLGEDTTAEEVKEFFEKYGRFDNIPAKVVKVNMAYKIKEYIDITRKYEETRNILNLYEHCKTEGLPMPKASGCCSSNEIDVKLLTEQLEDLKAKREKFEKDMPIGVGRDLLVGQAFVTFETQSDARAVEMRYGKELSYRIWDSIIKWFTCNKDTQNLVHRLKNRRIFARISNEASDIFWENLEISTKDRFKNIIKTSIFTVFAVSISFAMVISMKYIGKVEKDAIENNDNDGWGLRLISIWPSIIIIIINFVLGRSTRYFSSFERPHTVTAYNASVSIKLTIAMFVNTALIPLIVNVNWKNSWFEPGGLVTEATYLLISNAFISPMIYLLSPTICLHKLRMKKVEKAVFISQSEANKMFENPPVDIAQRYANVGKTILLTFCYGPLVPSGFLLSFVGLILEYWVSKYLLLRRHSWPQRLSGDLSALMIQILPWGVLLYAIMNYIYMAKLSFENSGLAFFWMIAVIGYVAFPLESLICCCRKNDVSIWEREHFKEKYEDIAETFIDDFDRANPVTVTQGWNWMTDLLIRKKLVDPDQGAKMKAEIDKKSNHIFESIQQYAVNRENVDQLEARKFGLNLLKIGLNSYIKFPKTPIATKKNLANALFPNKQKDKQNDSFLNSKSYPSDINTVKNPSTQKPSLVVPYEEAVARSNAIPAYPVYPAYPPPNYYQGNQAYYNSNAFLPTGPSINAYPSAYVHNNVGYARNYYQAPSTYGYFTAARW